MSEVETMSTELVEVNPAETPDMEIMKTISAEDPEVTVARMEKMAELAPRWRIAMRTILMTLTYPGDWETFGKGEKAKVCLGYAGVARLSTKFPIQFFEVQEPKKEEWVDTIGKAYRYIVRGKARLGEHITYAEGIFSTREQFFGKVGENWKPIEEINENNIRRAAVNVFKSNAIKDLLGLRAMPLADYQELMNRTGQKTDKTTGHSYGGGTKGGTKADDSARQRELAEACIAIVNAGYFVEKYQGKWKLCQMSDIQCESEPIELAVSLCVELSSFEGDKGLVSGKPAAQLKGKRLEITLKTANELKEKIK
jgi:hypothetical protein